jgi:hypothetical protein
VSILIANARFQARILASGVYNWSTCVGWEAYSMRCYYDQQTRPQFAQESGRGFCLYQAYSLNDLSEAYHLGKAKRLSASNFMTSNR